MIKLQLDDKTIEVNPHLTISKYQKIQKNPVKYKDLTEILSLYLDLEANELKDLPVDRIEFMEQVIMNHMSEPTNEVVWTFNHNGKTYGMENDWGNMTWGQWVDMEVFSQNDKINDNIHVIMALLYRPIVKQKGDSYKLEKFKSSDVMERAEEFLTLPVNYWFGCANFFFHISKEYVGLIESSLKRKVKREKWIRPLRKILPKWLLPSPPQDFSLNSPFNYVERTSPSSNE
jgi:hypothetical protein